MSWLDDIFSTTGAPAGATYVTISLDGTLTAERTLAVAAGQVALSDGGANGAVTLGLATTAVSAAEYVLPTLTVDDYGRVTACASATDIELPAGAARSIGVAATSGDAGVGLTLYPGAGDTGDDDGDLLITDGSDNQAIRVYNAVHADAGAAITIGCTSTDYAIRIVWQGSAVKMSFFDETPVARQTVNWWNTDTATLKSLMTALVASGLIDGAEQVA
jgi:hypothetical protein